MSAYFIERGGLVAVDLASDGVTKVAGSTHNWDVIADSGAVNSNVVRSLPDSGTNYSTAGDASAPYMEVDIHFTTAGTYYIWFHGKTPASSADSAHCRLGSGSFVTLNGGIGSTSAYSWGDGSGFGGPFTVTATAGSVQTFQIWMREDGVYLDRLVLTTSSSYDPDTDNGGDGPASSTYYDSANHVANLTIDGTTPSATHTNFPKLIRGSDFPAGVWSTATASGGDIRIFLSDGATEVAREIVSFDNVGEEAEIWVKIPTLTAGLSGTDDTVLQIHADGVSSDYAVTDTYGRNAVWVDFDVVAHLNAGGAVSLVDSSGNHADATYSLGSASNLTPTTIGDISGLTFDGSVVFEFNTNSMDSGEYTVTLLAAIGEVSEGLVGGINGEKGSAGESIRIDNAGTEAGRPRVQFFSQGADWDRDTGIAPSTFYTANDPLFIGLSNNDTSKASYLGLYGDGALQSSDNGTATGALPGNAENFIIGASHGTSNRLVGSLGYVRQHSLARSSDWIADEYADQSGNAAWHSITAVGGGAPGGTTVNADAIVQYHIRQIAAAELQTLHGITNLVASDMQALQNVLNLVNRDSSHPANLAQLATADSQHLANIRALASSSFESLYNILSLAVVGANLQLVQGIAELVTADTETPFSMRENVASDAALIAGIRQLVSQDSQLPSTIRELVAGNIQLIFDLLQTGAVGRDLGLTFGIREFVSADSVLPSNVLTAVAQDIDLLHRLLNAVSADSEARYSLAELASTDLEARYNVLADTILRSLREDGGLKLLRIMQANKLVRVDQKNTILQMDKIVH